MIIVACGVRWIDDRGRDGEIALFCVWDARRARGPSVLDRPSAERLNASSQRLSRASNAGFPCFLNRFSFARTR